MSPQVERPKPPYRQVADHLREQIMHGQLKAGDTVPSERQLADEWKISRSTATKALSALRMEGLIEARQGTGTVVTDTNSLYRGVNDRYGTVRRTGRIYTDGEYAKIAQAELVTAAPVVAEALGLEAGAQVIRRHRITFSAQDRPLACSTSWFAASLAEAAPLLLSTERIRKGTGAYVEESTGRRLSRGRDRVFARLASPHELSELLLPEPSAVLVTCHIAWDASGEPMTYEEGIAPPERWTAYEYDIES